jgi:zinc protease
MRIVKSFIPIHALSLWIFLGSIDAFAYTIVKQINDKVPVAVVKVVFKTGSAFDPKGKEGLSHLAAQLMREGGVKALLLDKKSPPLEPKSREQIEEFLFPLAATIDIRAEREQITFSMAAPANAAKDVFDLMSQMVLAPAFIAEEFDRLKSESLDYVAKRAPVEDQEELGKAALERFMYGVGHPYAHAVEGTRSGIAAIELADIAAFIKQEFSQDRMVVGVAGQVEPQLISAIARRFKSLPQKGTTLHRIPEVAPAEKLKLYIVQGPFQATGVHFGHPINVTRSHSEFPDMFLASQAFGKHRAFVGRLMHVVREVRGLNYGTYSYVEEFPDGGKHLTPPTQVARSRQAFTVWARPTPVANGCFLTRQIYRELNQLAGPAPKGGLTKVEFDNAKAHLIGAVPLVAASIDRQLGYALDGTFYGIGTNPIARLVKGLQKATQVSVNKNIRAHIHPDRMTIVVVTPDAESFKKAILSKECGIQYAAGIEKSKDILDEDKKIAHFMLQLKEDDIQIVNNTDIYK